MDEILCNIVKQQNLWLLRKIAAKFEKNEDYLIQMYHTPTFYKPELSKTKKSTACIFSNS